MSEPHPLARFVFSTQRVELALCNGTPIPFVPALEHYPQLMRYVLRQICRLSPCKAGYAVCMAALGGDHRLACVPFSRQAIHKGTRELIEIRVLVRGSRLWFLNRNLAIWKVNPPLKYFAE